MLIYFVRKFDGEPSVKFDDQSLRIVAVDKYFPALVKWHASVAPVAAIHSFIHPLIIRTCEMGLPNAINSRKCLHNCVFLGCVHD